MRSCYPFHSYVCFAERVRNVARNTLGKSGFMVAVLDQVAQWQID